MTLSARKFIPLASSAGAAIVAAALALHPQQAFAEPNSRSPLSQIGTLGTPESESTAPAPSASPTNEKAGGGWNAVTASPNLEAGGAIAYELAVLATGVERGVQFGREPADNGRVFVATAAGKIVEMDNPVSGDRTVLLDIGKKIVNDHEAGILGFAFDPKFEQTRKIFVHYIGKRSGSPLNRLSSFILDSKVGLINADTEEVLVDLPQPEPDHAGGQVLFGPDGMLYYGVGDGGGRSDPKRKGQSANDLYGAILRLDINEKPYLPPLDNPFVSNRDGMKEIWALGLRNPTSLSFDPNSRELWAGDTGLGEFQEINLITAGGNYGWSVLDGSLCMALRFECMNQKYIAPVVSYPSKTGASLVVGPVYQGLEHETLRGELIFLDRIQGTVWSMKRDSPPKVLLQTKRAISTIGTNIDGELLFADFDRGEILKLRKSAGSQ